MINPTRPDYRKLADAICDEIAAMRDSAAERISTLEREVEEARAQLAERTRERDWAIAVVEREGNRNDMLNAERAARESAEQQVEKMREAFNRVENARFNAAVLAEDLQEIVRVALAQQDANANPA